MSNDTLDDDLRLRAALIRAKEAVAGLEDEAAGVLRVRMDDAEQRLPELVDMAEALGPECFPREWHLLGFERFCFMRGRLLVTQGGFLGTVLAVGGVICASTFGLVGLLGGVPLGLWGVVQERSLVGLMIPALVCGASSIAVFTSVRLRCRSARRAGGEAALALQEALDDAIRGLKDKHVRLASELQKPEEIALNADVHVRLEGGVGPVRGVDGGETAARIAIDASAASIEKERTGGSETAPTVMHRDQESPA